MKASSICLMQLVVILLQPPLEGDEIQVSFQESQTIGSLANLNGAFADLDNDGDLDIFLSNYVGPSQVWFNDGQGFFSPGDFFGLSLSRKVTIADFDGDTFQDAFLPSNGIPTSLWFNDGIGQFTMSPQSMGNTTGEAAAGDFDADGDVDLFIGWMASIEDSFAVNDGSGVFSFPIGGTTSLRRAIAIGDLDADGDLDAFVAQGSTSSPIGDLVLFNDGQGNFQLQSVAGLGSSFGTDVELAVFDGDGDLDAFVTSFAVFGSSGDDKIWVNDGAGNFTDSGQTLGTLDSNDVAIADVDEDGDIDALVMGLDRKQRLWLNDGNGVFNEPIVIAELSDVSQGLLGDIDGDGDADAVFVTFQGTRVLKNNAARELVPDSQAITRGISVSGDASSLAKSDNVDLTIRRSNADIQSRTEFEVKAVSPVASPTSLEVSLEGSVFARSQVNQTIELFDYVAGPAGQWEQVDTRAATRFTDSTVKVATAGDLSRFVEAGTMCMKARIRYQSPVARHRFGSNTDQFIWTIGQ